MSSNRTRPRKVIRIIFSIKMTDSITSFRDNTWRSANTRSVQAFSRNSLLRTEWRSSNFENMFNNHGSCQLNWKKFRLLSRTTIWWKSFGWITISSNAFIHKCDGIVAVEKIKCFVPRNWLSSIKFLIF